MSNRLHIDTVQVHFLRQDGHERQDLYGFLIHDDYAAEHSVLDFTSEAEVPATLEAFLRYIEEQGYAQVSDLVAEHTSAQKGLYLDGDYVDAPELAQVLFALAHESTTEGTS
jgi:hypothetical protein